MRKARNRASFLEQGRKNYSLQTQPVLQLVFVPKVLLGHSRACLFIIKPQGVACKV